MLLKASVPQSNPAKISLSIDLWTAINQDSYAGINIHYFNTEWKPVTFLLDFVKIIGSHSGENLGKLLYEVLLDYELQNKVSRCLVGA